MKKYLLLFITLVSFVSHGQDQETLAEIQSIENTEITSKFVDLTPTAIERGLREIILIGKNNEVNKLITWHSISRFGEGGVKSKVLTNQLESDYGDLKIGTIVTVRGNLDQLLIDFQNMQDELTELEPEDEDSYLSEENNVNSSGGGSGSSGDSSDSNNGDFAIDTNSTFKDTEQCEDEIDYNDNKVYSMQKDVTKDENGNIVSSGACAKTGVSRDIETTQEVESCENQTDFINMKVSILERTITTDEFGVKTEGACEVVKVYDIKKDYDTTCPNSNNINEKEHYLGYQLYYSTELDDSKKEYVSACKLDTDDPKTIDAERAECEVTEDLLKNTATINKQWYYDNNGEKVYVTSCVASDEVYEITTEECTPYMNELEGKVYRQERKVWTDSDGQKHYPTECKPTADALDIETEYSSELSHNFNAGMSYKLSRNFYYYNGDKVYINDFSIDPAYSYKHTYSTTGCQVSHQDGNLRSQLYEKTTIVVDGSTKTIKNCSASNNYVSYINTGTSQKLIVDLYRFGLGVYSTIKSETFYVWEGDPIPQPYELCEELSNNDYQYSNAPNTLTLYKLDSRACNQGERYRTCYTGDISSYQQTQQYRRVDSSIYSMPLNVYLCYITN